MQTPSAQLFWFRLLEAYCSCPKLLNSHGIPLLGYPINLWAPHHIFWNLEGYCITLAKLRRKAIPASFYDNILNHETNECFLYIFSMLIISYIVIQINEGITKSLYIDGKM
jgi:hypothetical protein